MKNKPKGEKSQSVVIKADTSILTFNDSDQTLTITPRFGAPRHNKKVGPVTIPYEAIGGTKSNDLEMQIIIAGRRNDISVGVAGVSNPLVIKSIFDGPRTSTAEKIREITSAPRTGNRSFIIPPIKVMFNEPLLAFGEIRLEGDSIIYNEEMFPIAGAKATFTAAGGETFSAGGAMVGRAVAGSIGAVIGGIAGAGGKGTLIVTLPNGRTVTAIGGKAADGAKICNDINQWGGEKLITIDEDIDEQDLRIIRAEQAEIVRGKHQSKWCGEVERLTASERFAEAEELLIEMRDAVAESTRIAGWAVPFGPTQMLLALYLKQGRVEDADKVLADYLDCVRKYRVHVPEGGDTGEHKAREWVEVLSGPKARAHWKERGSGRNGRK